MRPTTLHREDKECSEDKERREELSTPLCTVKIRSGGKTRPTQQKQKRPLKVSLGCPCTASDVLFAPPLCTMDMRKGGKKCLHHFAHVLVAPPLFSNPRRLHAYLGAGHLSEVPEEAGTWVVAYCFRCARWIITLPPKTHLKRMLLLLGKKMRPTTLHREDKECSEDKERREELSTPLCTVKIRSGGKTSPTQQKQKRPLKVSLGCPCTASDVLVAPPLCTMDMRKGGKNCLHHFARWIITLPPKTHLKRMLLLLGKKMRPTTLHREDKECSEDKERREELSTPLCTVKIRSGGKTRPTQQKQKRPLKVSLGCPCTASDVLVAPPLCTMDMRKGGKKCLHHFARWIITLPCTASDVLVAPPLFSNPRRLHAYLGAGHLSEVPEGAGT
ncbi:hypothetical protein PAMP_016525 [Pampus punctatissimus]